MIVKRKVFGGGAISLFNQWQFKKCSKTIIIPVVNTEMKRFGLKRMQKMQQKKKRNRSYFLILLLDPLGTSLI